MSRSDFSKYVAQVVMAVCGLSHTYNTKVGNDYIRGVSGGERKRVSIAEMMVAGSSIGAWDNRYECFMTPSLSPMHLSKNNHIDLHKVPAALTRQPRSSSSRASG